MAKQDSKKKATKLLTPQDPYGYLASRKAEFEHTTSKEAFNALLFCNLSVSVEDKGRKYFVQTFPGRFINGHKTGPINKSRVMVVNFQPNPAEEACHALFFGEWAQQFRAMCEKCDAPFYDWYYTTVMKHKMMYKKSQPPVAWMKWSEPLLQEEIKRVDPEIIVVLGAKALKYFLGRKATLDDYQSRPVEWNGRILFPIMDPSATVFNPHAWEIIELDIIRLTRFINGELDTDDIEENYQYIDNIEELKSSVDSILNDPEYTGWVSFDCEWSGSNPLSGALRTIQFCWKPGNAIVPIFRRTGNEKTKLGEDIDGAFQVLKPLVEGPNTKLIGHFVRADLPWLYKHGLDPTIAMLKGWDTSIAGHLLDERWRQALEVYTIRYTNMGRYDSKMKEWQHKVGKEHLKKFGFRFAPDGLMLPYAARDADATFRIFLKEQELLFLPENAELLHLFLTRILPANLPIMEIEQTGMLIDKKRLLQCAEIYTSKRSILREELQNILNWSDFNPDSPDHKVAALFNWFKKDEQGQQARCAPVDAQLRMYEPLKSTKKKPWKQVRTQGLLNDPENGRPAADRSTLLTLRVDFPQDPLVEKLLYYTAVAQICKNFTGTVKLELDKTTGAMEKKIVKGLIPKLWVDGKAHCRIRQLLETGRYSHKEPNIAQLPKSAEALVHKCFEEEQEEIPNIRTCFICPPGWCFIDVDWVGAELWVMAWLSGDKAMQKVLQTPNADFHSMTALQLFDEITPPPKDWNKGIKAWVKEGGWNHFRTIAKTITFGIAYGRGAAAVAQVVYEQGSEITVRAAQNAIDAFKRTYPSLTRWLEARKVDVHERGFVVNAYGRKRRFAPTHDRAILASQERRAMNMPIQGTVSDLMSEALVRIWAARRLEKPHLNFKILMSIHDQILSMCPIEEIKETMELIVDCMTTRCPIPKINLCLKVDPEICIRWGEKLTKETAIENGIPIELL